MKTEGFVGTDYSIAAVNDLFILLIDNDEGKTITNNAHAVIEDLKTVLEGGLRGRVVYYRDTSERFDILLEHFWIVTFLLDEDNL